MKKIFEKIASLYYYGFKYWYFKAILGRLGRRTRIKPNLRTEYPENIFIGSNVSIGRASWLAASPYVDSSPRLVIGDGCNIGSLNQIYTTTSIIFESKVLTADRVYISDSVHDHKDISRAILDQPILSSGPMTIGEGSWIGINSCIMGASIGKNCVIGANSVVNKNIPDYCIAVGAPARIVKRYNLESGIWQRTDAEGNFI